MSSRVLTNAHLYAAGKIRAEFFDRRSAANAKPGFGTCFIVGTIGVRHFVVTNRHVVDAGFRGNYSDQLERVTISGWQQSIGDPERDVESWTLQLKSPIFKFPEDDKVDLAVALWSGDWINGPVLTGGEAGSNHYGVESLATSSELSELAVGDPVFVAGYPAVDGVVGERPILVSGTIASDPRYEAVFGNTRLPKSVLCHSFSWAGMSGAPILALSQGIGTTRVVGVNAGHIHSQGTAGSVLSHFVRSDEILAVIDEWNTELNGPDGAGAFVLE